ncbi:MAG: hypothetical protein JNL12_10850 [Planctomycetes bacterium]|nr:hypothetical protein [Planctomycetota bacterium]
MAIVVTHKEKGGRFVVLGANLAKWKTARAHALLGDFFPVEQEGADRVLVVCGADGVIQFGDADAFVVVEIDGVQPARLLA